MSEEEELEMEVVEELDGEAIVRIIAELEDVVEKGFGRIGREIAWAVVLVWALVVLNLVQILGVFGY